MFIIGLTGGIASGKSTVAGMLKDLGAEIIDADAIARQVVEPGRPALKKIAEKLGEEFINPDGTLNRAALGEYIFANPEARRTLNAITHPRIIEEVATRLRQIADRDSLAVAVIDAPLLLEVGMASVVDEVWVTYVPEETQIKRLMERDGLTLEQAQARLKAQMPIDEKLKAADRVINTACSLEATREQVLALWKQIPGANRG
ncbi:MAG: dephospho-CoA kinase [Clostridia bacterium]|nr:dephospho-CoA kinase [Clostridia bacterium]